MSNLQRLQQDEPVHSRAIMEAFHIGEDNGNIEAEQPTPRSLQMGSRVPSLIRPPAGGFGKVPRMFSSDSHNVPSLKGSLGVKQQWDDVVTLSSRWNVKNEDLEMVPEDFPLERTHRMISGVDASTVASRISEALRVNSIEAEFNSKPPKAKCKTRDLVSFRIRLYAGNDFGQPVIVEVQRRSGSVSCFMHVCRSILSAAEGKPCKENERKSPFNKPVGQLKCLRGAYGAENQHIDAANALHDAKELLRSVKRDANILGLESLYTLTDPIKTSPVVSLIVAKSIALALDGEDIRDEILAMTERDVFASSAAEDMEVAMQSAHFRQLALSILANILSLCERDGCLAKAMAEQRWFTEFLAHNLLDEIKRAESNACNAIQAAISLHSLAKSSSSFKERMVEQGMIPALQRVHAFGIEQNQLLANETRRCLEVIGGTSLPSLAPPSLERCQSAASTA